VVARIPEFSDCCHCCLVDGRFQRELGVVDIASFNHGGGVNLAIVMVVPRHMRGDSHVKCAAREPIVAQEERDCRCADASRCSDGVVPIDNSRNVTLLVHEDVLQIEILVMDCERLRGWLVEGRLREDNPENCAGTKKLVCRVVIAHDGSQRKLVLQGNMEVLLGSGSWEARGGIVASIELPMMGRANII
jgi:hypothetical protein